MDREDSRQLFHMFIGVGALAVLIVLGKGFLLAGVFFTIIIGLLLMNARVLGRRISLVQWFEKRFEREDAPLPGWGSACYATGALIAVSFLPDIAHVGAVLFMLGIGDGISTIVGRRGNHAIPYNKKKTVEGMVAMFFSSLAAWYFIGPLAVPLAFVAALAESIPRIDDNLTVPVLCTAFLLVIG